MAKDVFTSPIGISVYKGDWEGAEWTVTGFPSKELVKLFDFESAYDFEEYIQKNVKCKSITFDSEYCQFFAYAKTKAGAVAFAKAIEKKFTKVKEEVGRLLSK